MNNLRSYPQGTGFIILCARCAATINRNQETSVPGALGHDIIALPGCSCPEPTATHCEWCGKAQ